MNDAHISQVPRSSSASKNPGGARIEAAIFDVDGTLVDSNDAHAHSWVDAFREFDITVSFEKIRPLIGMGGDKLMPIVAGVGPDEPGGREIAKRRSMIFRRDYL